MSEAESDAEVKSPGGQPVVLRVAQLALRDRIALVAQVAPVDSHFPPIQTITNTNVQRRERRRQRRVSLVQITGARVLDDDIADNVCALSDHEPRREHIARRNFEAPDA